MHTLTDHVRTRSSGTKSNAHRAPPELVETKTPGAGSAACLSLDRQSSLELEYAAHRFEYERVGLLVERFHHADEIAGGGD